ncbi:ferredoxin [Heliobacterium gestii]|uniref:Ferredoxin n=1 Tax=Heliomicrobium gestii TaxID=2699 RepID=A0A845LGH5_HELGE|nr:4Fe-4S binding protein [Heliomicrobium gestii]MBM7867425.1 Pyruvate/2-oxoacid:ferredoxin oxidoreductase delta subunit [Heliomicrobium gestii]MZP43689.1 ferredoxin [Heliomicrobium gestii]
MKRKIVTINEEKCNGCGLCVSACHEGALQLVEGKAKLVSDVYCDGLGDCLPECPTDAITLVEREAEPFDEVAVKERIEERKQAHPHGAASACDRPATAPASPSGCPGMKTRLFQRTSEPVAPSAGSDAPVQSGVESQLRQWPCQLKLVSPRATFFDNCHLLIAADCTAFAYAGIHHEFMKNKITLIGCPKLDDIDYAEKLTEILATHELQSLTVLRMEVPCCGGIVNAVKKALAASGKIIPWQIVIIGTDGRIVQGV